MKCQHCGKNEATVYYRSTVNGRTTEVHLCPQCAQAEGYDQMMRPMRSMGLFDDPFFTRPFSWFDGLTSRLLTEFPAPVALEEAPQERAEQPADQPSGGLVDNKQQEELRSRRRRNELEQRLKTAIETENYEEAARVRDELRTLSA